MKSQNSSSILECVEYLRLGEIIAYPTESCFGLGCNPNNLVAIEKIYDLKHRPNQMPFIIIISEWAHLDAFDCEISDDQMQQLRSTWPGPVTWLIPIKTKHQLASDQRKIAVRMTDHPIASMICTQFEGAVVSTSANPHGLPSAKTAKEVHDYFGNKVSYILDGPLGDRTKPSDIFDLGTNQQLR